ncbi:MAG: RsmB/NOP family class I SAM-dependent RNA methyltransferase [Bradyrhizobiaceae bacterium]|nr:RsmB/NOP family class I SAM-dependent RNA methyltransferase [Bradyrhizobiaceae bacterium]
MQLTSLLGHASELVRIIRKSAQPADALTREYLRSRKYIGASDRRFISGHTFHTLRILALAEAYGKEHQIDDVVQAAYEVDCTSAWVQTQSIDVQVCAQPWLLESTQQRWTDAAEVWRAMMQPAPLGIRVNLRRATRDAVVQRLHADNIHAVPSPLSPSGLTIDERVNMLQHPLYLDGIIEIQDVGSQCISLATHVQPGMRVLDACAGAGGKTLHLADMMNGQGAIVSRDIEWNRLKEIAKRAARAGIGIITTELIDKRNDQRSSTSKPFDVVLIDAPCTGMGTVRRSPMVKWRLTPQALERHTRKQVQLLQQYSSEVIRGGTVVYATCSILPQENEHVVNAFLATTSEFELVTSQQLDPHHHQTDGLFWSVFTRKG